MKVGPKNKESLRVSLFENGRKGPVALLLRKHVQCTALPYGFGSVVVIFISQL